jgi:O-antigen/teichoic acid export membrane protein
MSSKGKVLENSFLYTFSSLLVKAVSFLLLPIYTKFLLPEDYGITNLAYGFINIATFIIAFSLYSAVIRFYTDYKEDPAKLKRFYSTIITFTLISGSIFIALGVILRSLLIRLFFKGIPFYPVVFIALFILLFISLNTIYQNILQSMQKGKKLTIINLILFFLQVMINLFLIGALKLGAVGVLLTLLIINVGYVIFMLVDLKRNKLISLRIDIALLKEALTYSIPIMPHNLSTMIAQFAAQIFVNRNGSLASVGLYGIASQFGSIIDVVQSSVYQAFAPWFYDMMNTSKEENKKSIVELSRLLLILYSLLYMVIGLFSQEVILLMTNDNYILSWTVIPMLVVGFSVKSIYYFYVAVLFYYKDAAKKIFIATISGSFADIVLAYLLVPHFGMYGAAISFFIAKVIMVTIVITICRKYNDIGYRVKNMILIIVPSLLFMGAGLSLSYLHYMTVFRWRNFALKIAVFIAYLVYIYLTNKKAIHNLLQSDKVKNLIKGFLGKRNSKS